MMMIRRQDERVFNELCSLVVTLLDSSPSSFSSSSSSSSIASSTTRTMTRVREQLTPAGFASVLLGVSLTLMLCGTVTFVIGVILMPWVLTLVTLFYVYGLISTLSGLGRAIFCPPTRKTHTAGKGF